MVVALGLLGFACIGYGVTIMVLNSGTLFFAVWYVLGIALLAAAAATHAGAWELVPTPVLCVGGALVACVVLVLLLALAPILSQIVYPG